MKSFIKLIRIQNLLIIAFTQYMVHWCIIYPILKKQGFALLLSDSLFFLLVLSTVMIAASGYIINDYFDVKIDKINKPERLIIGKGVKRRVAIGAHTVINILGFFIGFYVSYAIGNWKLCIIHFFWITGLWFYSTHFKRQFLVGNIVIVAFIVLVPISVGIYDLLPCYRLYGAVEDASFREEWIYVFAVAFFAGIITLLREIVKDIEDYEGDKELGCKTMPIVIGKYYSKLVAISIALCTMISLGMIQRHQLAMNNSTAFYYFLFLIQFPFLFLVYKIYTAETKRDYHIAGNITKLIMLSGVCYLFLFAFHLLKQINAI